MTFAVLFMEGPWWRWSLANTLLVSLWFRPTGAVYLVFGQLPSFLLTARCVSTSKAVLNVSLRNMGCLFWLLFYEYYKQLNSALFPLTIHVGRCSLLPLSRLSPPSLSSPIQLIHLCNTVSNLKPFCHICWRDNHSFSLTFCQLSVVEVFQLITWCKSYKINTQWEGEKWFGVLF